MDISRYIKVGTFIDGSGGPVHRNVFLAIKNGFIAAIVPAAELPENDAAPVDNLSNYTIVPALVDCSVSLSHSPSVDRRVQSTLAKTGLTEKTALAARHIHYCHSHGVLGVADGSDNSALIDHLKEMTPEKISIDIRTSGRDFLRIVYADILDKRTVAGSGPGHENLWSAIQQKGGKKIVVVANGAQRVQEALEAGCDAIEQGYEMGEDNLRKMADTGVVWIPDVLMAKNCLQGAGSGGDVTCRFSMGYTAPGKSDPWAETFWKKMLAKQLAQLRLAKKLGVITAVGTGAGNVGIIHGESVVEEMKLFIRAGWSLEETIQCATEIGAGFFGLDNLGALAVGRKATFLAARGTVQLLPRKLAYLENIYVAGNKWRRRN